MEKMTSTQNVALFGAALDTGNLGVEALATSFLDGIDRLGPGLDVTVFDNGWGYRERSISTARRAIPYSARGARLSRRLHRPESLYTMRALTPLRGLLNGNVRTLANAKSVADVSGGDSFTDMYGPRRFEAMVVPKDIVLRLGTPLILLPQTYGPFRSSETRNTAARLVQGATQCWARDAEGYAELQDLLGNRFDPLRHHSGVDMAFGLRPAPPALRDEQSAEVAGWVTESDVTAGINVSGLLMRPTRGIVQTDPMSIDYQGAMVSLVESILADGGNVLLVPHVLGSVPDTESDEIAIAKLIAGHPEWPRERVRVMPTPLTAGEAKWWIGQCDWFCGTRMHSTIAALSQGIATAAVAYSLKTRPVFATLGQENHVIDGRSSSTEEVLSRLTDSWRKRDETTTELRAALVEIHARADSQMTDIYRACVGEA